MIEYECSGRPLIGESIEEYVLYTCEIKTRDKKPHIPEYARYHDLIGYLHIPYVIEYIYSCRESESEQTQMSK